MVRNLLRAFTENNLGQNGLRIEPVYSTQNSVNIFVQDPF